MSVKKGNPKFAKKTPAPKVNVMPLWRIQQIEQMDLAARAVDELAKQMDAKWGVGRLPLICGVDWASKFAVQSTKFRDAYRRYEFDETMKHCQAMERAYKKLDEIATAAGHQPVPPEQWEFEADGKLIILVRDTNRMNQIDAKGREYQAWSLDEVANVIRLFPILSAAKDAFPGAEIVETRPARIALSDLNDSTDGLGAALGWG